MIKKGCPRSSSLLGIRHRVRKNFRLRAAAAASFRRFAARPASTRPKIKNSSFLLASSVNGVEVSFPQLLSCWSQFARPIWKFDLSHLRLHEFEFLVSRKRLGCRWIIPHQLIVQIKGRFVVVALK